MAETFIGNKHSISTLGFDATTQEGQHVNSIHFTTQEQCLAAAVDELPGGTAADYHHHITDTVDNLASVYSYFNDKEFQESRINIISNISNTLTHRCAANHAAIELLNETLDKHLNELYCHLHTSDTIATSTRSAMKEYEKTEKHVIGSDCLAGDIVQVSKLRHKDGKGDPRGF